jgi:lysyl endopeptidase
MLKKPLLFFAWVIYSLAAAGQADRDIKPLTFRLSARLFPTPDERVYPFDSVQVSLLDHRDDKDGHMPRFARFLPADISLANAGTWTTLPGGGRVWRIGISSPGALALIPCFDAFLLPPGATLHVYTPARDEVLGAFTSSNNPHDGRYNTGLIHGDYCIIEYYEPAAVAGQGRIHMNELGHAYRMVPPLKQGIGFGGSEPCEVNVRCPEGDNWQDTKNAIVRILVKAGSDAGWCSGSLVNNANQDCSPYVLSADHCYQDEVNNWADPSASDLSQWVFYFQFESPSCSDPASQGALANDYMTGCTFAAASLDDGGTTGSDFSLLKLNTTPPLSYIPYYAGWSNINTASHSGAGIHHPAADIKKISTYDQTLLSTSFGGITPDTHWQVQWIPTISGHGVTEPGSSGSPIFDVNAHIVGTLTGGQSDCSTPDSADLYGKFSYHWAGNGSADSTRLQPWLDPNNTGIQTLAGIYGPCAATIPLDAAITAIAQTGTQCDASIAIACTLTNYGSSTLTSDSLSFTIDGGSPQILLWMGSLGPLQSAQVSLPAQIFLVGTHTITITSAAPNGGADGNTTNDSRTATFTVAPPDGDYSFYLQTGDQGSEVTWELADATDNILYSGGPYTNNASGQTVSQAWCLPDNCYIFTIFSTSGNGWEGNILNGAYFIINSFGDTISQLHTVDFDNEDTVIFCQDRALGVSSITPLSAISVYPNPSSGIYTASHIQHVSSITVTDALGRVISTIDTKAQYTMQIDLSKEESGIYFFHFISDQGTAVRKVVLDSGR